MKKTIILFAAMVVALGAAATDRFHIEDFTISPGDTCTVNIMLDNEMAYTAFQSDLYLPDGLTAMNFALTDRKSTNHSFTATVLPDGGIRLLSYSLNLKTYSGNSGALVTFDVIASEDFEGPVEITLRSSLFTTEAGIERKIGRWLIGLITGGNKKDEKKTDKLVDIQAPEQVSETITDPSTHDD